MGSEVRASRSLSGGERFLVSLGLAFALSGLEERQGLCDVLLIDESFGSVDSDSLDFAVEALETLQGFGRKVSVVTHVAAMVERITTQVRVTKRGGGWSVVEMQAACISERPGRPSPTPVATWHTRSWTGEPHAPSDHPSRPWER